MVRKKMRGKTSAPETAIPEDELGIPQFDDGAAAAPMARGYHDPFERMMKATPRDGPSAVRDAAIRVHGDLDVARSIAVSIYGRKWEAHVIEVFDRLQLIMNEEQDRAIRPEDPGPDEDQNDAH